MPAPDLEHGVRLVPAWLDEHGWAGRMSVEQAASVPAHGLCATAGLLPTITTTGPGA